MPYQLPLLPYDYDAMMPHIDEETMLVHYTKHHAAYIVKLNEALAKENIPAPECVYSLLKDLSKLPESIRAAVRNNGGGHANHSFFWELLSPEPTQPHGQSLAAIESTFGDIENMKKAFTEAALSRFGSGWAWLIVTPDLKLVITSTPNQDHPCMAEAPVQGWPIIGLDVWEHAYYLKYKNLRADYIKAFWNVLNYNTVEKHYQMALDYYAGQHGTSKSCSLPTT